MKKEEDPPRENGVAPPFTGDVKAEVQLTPPAQDPASVEENVTKSSVVDIERYLRWADKLLRRTNSSDKAA